MNPCIKTGADVWLNAYGGHLHGDLYHIEGVYILRYVGKVSYTKRKLECDAVFTDTSALDNQRMALPRTLDLNPFRSDCGTIVVVEDYVQNLLGDA